MTNKDLRRMSRSALLELLIEQIEENERLMIQIEELKERLESKQIAIEEAGSIAQAALQLNDVFLTAENAANQYLENIQRLSEQKEESCRLMEEEARAKADEIVEEAVIYSRNLKAKANNYWKQAKEKIDQMQAQAQTQE